MTFSRPVRASQIRFAAVVGTLALLAAVWLPAEAEAQTRWQQTFQVITPIQEGSPVSALRDSVVDVALRENLSVRRTPDEESPRPMRQVEDELLSDGLDFTSANRLFIRYRFEAERGELKRQIEDLHFIYRPEGAEGTDLSILQVDLDEPLFADLMANSGMQLRTNEASFTPFRDQLMFYKLPESQLVALGGNIIRDAEEAETERRRLLRAVQRFLY